MDWTKSGLERMTFPAFFQPENQWIWNSCFEPLCKAQLHAELSRQVLEFPKKLKKVIVIGGRFGSWQTTWRIVQLYGLFYIVLMQCMHKAFWETPKNRWAKWGLNISWDESLKNSKLKIGGQPVKYGREVFVEIAKHFDGQGAISVWRHMCLAAQTYCCKRCVSTLLPTLSSLRNKPPITIAMSCISF